MAPKMVRSHRRCAQVNPYGVLHSFPEAVEARELGRRCQGYSSIYGKDFTRHDRRTPDPGANILDV